MRTTDRRRGCRTRTAALSALLVVVVLTSCGSDVGERVATRDRPDATRPLLRGCDSPDEAAASGFSTIYQFDSLDDWASHADVIARFEVVKESAGPLDEFEMEVPRYLDLRLTEVYSGPAQVGETFRMWDLIGWDQQPDGTLLQMTGPGCFRIEVGDDIMERC